MVTGQSVSPTSNMQPPRSGPVQVGMSNPDETQCLTSASVIPSPHTARIVATLVACVQGSHPVQDGSVAASLPAAHAAVKNC